MALRKSVTIVLLDLLFRPVRRADLTQTFQRLLV